MDGANVSEVAKKLGLEEGLIKNIEKSQQTKKVFLDVVAKSGLTEANKKTGNMLYSVATKLPVVLEKFRDMLAKEVGTGDISNANQLDYIIDYLLKQEKKGGVDLEKYAKDCGIGVKLTAEDFNKIVEQNIKDASQTSNKFEYLNKIKAHIPYADGKALKDVFDAAWLARGLPEKPVAEKKPVKKEE